MGEELFPGSEVADRGGRIQTGLGLFVPCGLRAGAQVPRGGIEPPTRGFSVEVLTDSSIRSICCKRRNRVC